MGGRRHAVDGARGDLAEGIRAGAEAIAAAVAVVVPGSLRPEEAMAAVAALAEAERVVASAIARLSPRVCESGVYAKAGYASAPEWLGALAGTSAGAARGRLAAAGRAASVPALASALEEGELSSAELSVLAQAEAAAPGSAAPLLELVEGGAGHQALCDEAARMKAAARAKEAECERRAKVHALRHLRVHQCEAGGIRGEFFLDETQWARVQSIIEAEARARFKAAGSDDPTSFEAHRLDAFIDLLAGAKGTGGSRGSRARAEVLVLVDAEALRRGTTATGEICEIEGIGPVPVQSAIELLGEGSLRFLVKEGTDIKTVTRASRDLAKKTAIALVARDRACVVPGCGKHLGLQADHCHVDYADDGPTTYENLALLCPAHHDMMTHGGWKLTGEPGNWQWIPPPRPPSAGRIARQRKVTVAKATARRQT